MHNILVLSVLSLSGVCALRLPVFEPGPKSFSIQLVKNNNYAPDCLADLQRTYSKYGIPSRTKKEPTVTRRGVRHTPPGRGHKRQVGSNTRGGKSIEIVDTANRELEYINEITVGDQNFKMILDTCSADSWIASTLIPKSSRKDDGRYYDPSKSSTYKHSDTSNFNVQYYDHSYVSGAVGTDAVTVDDGTIISSQSLGLAKNISNGFIPDGADGVLGLRAQGTFLRNIASQKLLSLPIFAVDIKNDDNGSYDFGFIDHVKHRGSLTYVNATAEGSSSYDWKVTSTKYKIGSQDFQSARSEVAVLDTASKFLLLSPDATKNYWDGVPGSEYDNANAIYTYPCNSTDSLQALSVDVAGNFADIPGYLLNAGPMENDAEKCLGGLQATKDAASPLVYGELFFKATYVVFDFEKNSVGFAPKAQI